MPVTVYRYDDVGAPVLSSPSAGSLIGVLDACLVNGYGSKSPAGWTKPYSGTNLAAYRQGSGSRFYLRVYDGSGTKKASVVGYESMTGISSGSNLFPTAAQHSAGLYITIGTTAAPTGQEPWVLVAVDKRFYLWIGFEFTSASALSDSVAGQGLFFFGDIVSFKPSDAYCCQIMASNSSRDYNEAAAEISAITTFKSGHFIARNAAGAAGAINNTKFSDYYGCKSGTIIGRSAAVAYPDPVSGGINLSRMLVSNGTATAAVRGRFPGFWAPSNALPGANGDTFSGSGDLAGRVFILLDCASASGSASTVRGRAAIEISDTWD